MYICFAILFSILCIVLEICGVLIYSLCLCFYSIQSLKHQRKRKSDRNDINNSWRPDRGAKTFQAEKYREGACEK